MNSNPQLQFDRLTAIIRERQKLTTAARQELEILLFFCTGKSSAACKVRMLLYLIFTSQTIPQTSGLGSRFDKAFAIIAAAVARKSISRCDLEALLQKHHLYSWFAIEEDMLTSC